MNALAIWLKVQVKREGKLHFQEYRRGVPQDTVRVVGEAEDGRTGYAMAVEHKPEVIIMDISLPLLGGMSAVFITLFVVPILYSWGEEVRLARRRLSSPTGAGEVPTPATAQGVTGPT